MESLTIKELRKIEKWYADHEEEMDASDNKVYEKINMIIEEMEDVNEEDSIKTSYYDDDPEEDSEEDKDNYYYENFDEDEN